MHTYMYTCRLSFLSIFQLQIYSRCMAPPAVQAAKSNEVCLYRTPAGLYISGGPVGSWGGRHSWGDVFAFWPCQRSDNNVLPVHSKPSLDHILTTI